MKTLLSFVLPFYKRVELLRLAVPCVACYREPQVEVVLCLDEPTQAREALDAVQSMPWIRWRVLVNEKDHAWRPPCKAINVGIRHAKGTAVAVCSPESLLDCSWEHLQDVVHSLEAQRQFVCGYLWQPKLPKLPAFLIHSPMTYSAAARHALLEQPTSRHGYGFTMALRSDFVGCGGYDEGRSTYGGDDDDLHARLVRFGVPKTIDPNIKVVSFKHGGVERVDAVELWPGEPKDFSQHGLDFSTVLYDSAIKAES